MMTNDESCGNMTFTLKEANGQSSSLTLPKLAADEAYKYLGIHFTINLDLQKDASHLIKQFVSLTPY